MADQDSGDWGRDSEQPRRQQSVGGGRRQQQRQVQWPGAGTPAKQAYQSLLARARVSADHADRVKLYEAAESILANEVLTSPVFYDREHLLTKPWVRRAPLFGLGALHFEHVIIGPH